MNAAHHLARERIVAIWLNRPREERTTKHTEPFITELERGEKALLSQLRCVNHYQTIMGLIRSLTTD
jgi:hypothetical protein